MWGRACSLLLGLSACGGDGAVDAGARADTEVTDAGPAAADPYCVTGEDREGPLSPDRFCPGSAGCTDDGDGALLVGAAAVDVTPVLGPDVEMQTVDVNGNGVYEPEQGDEFDDLDGDGKLDAVWIGGFGNARAASGVHDPQWARFVALQRGETTIAIGALDTPIFFLDEVDAIRAMVADLELDYVVIASTHCHMCRDNIGFWGVSETEPGRDDAYNAFLREQAARAIREAVGRLAPAHVQYASFRLRDQPGGTLRYVSDSRDPRIIDDRVRLVRFVDAGDDTTIATIVNWGSHAQYMGEPNSLLSSDFPHSLREGVERGAPGPDGEVLPGVGGVAVFISGPAGGQVGNERMQARTWAGEDLPREGIPTAETVGTQVAWFALRALGPDGGSVTDETAELAFRSFTFLATVENRVFHTALLNDLFDRGTCSWDDELVIVPGDNQPDVRTEIAVLDVGRARMVTIPGELDPALAVGGYDGSFTPEGVAVVDETLPNPPDLSRAPGPPYLVDLAGVEPEYLHLMTLTLDYIGYMVPEFDYELDRGRPYFDEAAGDHYEETRSLGPESWPELRAHLADLLAWSPP